MRSLSVKLILAFLLVALSGIAILAIFGIYSTQREFGRYLNDQYSVGIADVLSEYYASHGTWEGVDTVLPVAELPVPRDVRPSPRGPMGFTVYDSTGEIVLKGGGQSPGSLPEHPEQVGAIPIEVNDQTVGWILFRGDPFREGLSDNAFLARVNQTLIISAALATALALVLGVILARTLTRQLDDLTRGTQAIADGDFEYEVPVRSNDELGHLAESFNTMSHQLFEIQNQRRQMTADIAHELRTPISLILGHADAVHDQILPPSDETFELIRDEALRLERIVEDLRTLSRADAGELTVRPEPVDPEQLVQQAASAHKPMAHGKGIEIDLEIGGDMPQILVDPDRIAQVLGNLVTNAIQYSIEDGEVTLLGKTESDQVMIGVRDNGPGIDASELPNIFDRFYRTDKSRQRESGGSGLGLAIAKSLVETQGGRIWAESTLGQGTTIWISFPQRIENGA